MEPLPGWQGMSSGPAHSLLWFVLTQTSFRILEPLDLPCVLCSPSGGGWAAGSPF